MAPATASESLGLSPLLLARLGHLRFRSRQSVIGSGAGQRLSPRVGTSVEFSDYRTYVAGDDFRRVDWNAYARHDRLMLRLYLGEEDLSVHLFVDTSDSMRWGTPRKDVASRTIAGALAYVALSNLDRVAVTGFADRVTASLRTQRGRQSCPRVWKALRDLGSGSTSDFRSLRPVIGSLRPGISVILSDFFTEAGLGPFLASLRSARQQVILLQVLAPQEINPEVTGDVALLDIETGSKVEVTITPALLQSYRDAMAEHTARLTALAHAHNALWYRVQSDAPVDRLVMDTFRRIGILE